MFHYLIDLSFEPENRISLSGSIANEVTVSRWPLKPLWTYCRVLTSQSQMILSFPPVANNRESLESAQAKISSEWVPRSVLNFSPNANTDFDWVGKSNSRMQQSFDTEKAFSPSLFIWKSVIAFLWPLMKTLSPIWTSFAIEY